MANKDKIVFCFVGDMTTDREKPETMLQHVAPILKDADIAFGQLDSVLSERGCRQVHVGKAVRVHPKNVKSYTSAGFDVLSFASNHTLDYGYEGLEDTLNVVRENGIAIIGAGKNIDEARKPAIIKCKGTKFGFLAYCSVIPSGFEATPKRPGLAPIKVHTVYAIKDYQLGAAPKVLTFANQEDLKAMKEDIAKLRPLVDVLVLSHHGGLHFIPAVIPMYQKEITHAAIDAGADIVLGHHARILKGIEVYKKKVIFYGLCNFGIEILPTQSDDPDRPYKFKLDPECPNYPCPKDSQMTILGKCIISNKKITKVSFFPVYHNKNAEPEIMSQSDKRSEKIINYLKRICKDQGLSTKLSRDGDEVVIKI